MVMMSTHPARRRHRGVAPRARESAHQTGRRLAAEGASLQRWIDEHDRLIAVLQKDLAASRQAHADDIGRLTADTTSPVVVIRHQP
jgi:hypothetical protein